MVGDILQPTHLIFVLVVALLVLGPKKLPEVGRQLGNGLRDFRAAINGERPEHEEVTAPYEQPAPDTGAEHAFAHQPGEPTVEDHEFAHTGSEVTAEEPAPAHASPATAADGHEFAHQPETSAADPAENGETPAGGHEFAYETSESSDKRTDPLA
jgi:sec-independent protein translocase protein TatA